MRSNTLLSVVISIYGSEAYLDRVVSELVASLKAVRSFEIILVKDCSPDGVQWVIDRLCVGDGHHDLAGIPSVKA